MRSLNASLEQRVQDRVAELASANAKLQAEIVQRQKAEDADPGPEDGGRRPAHRRPRP